MSLTNHSLYPLNSSNCWQTRVKLYNIQLHKVNLVGQDLAGAVFSTLWGRWCDTSYSPYGENSDCYIHYQWSCFLHRIGSKRFMLLRSWQRQLAPGINGCYYYLLVIKAAPNLVVDKGDSYKLSTQTHHQLLTTPPTPPLHHQLRLLHHQLRLLHHQLAYCTVQQTEAKGDQPSEVNQRR